MSATLPPLGKGATVSTSALTAAKRGQRKRGVPVIEKGVPEAEAAAQDKLEEVTGDTRKSVAMASGTKATSGRRKKSTEPPAAEQKGKRDARRNSNSAHRLSKVQAPTLRKLRPKPSAPSLPSDIAVKAKQVFMEFDTDSNGLIDAIELRTALKALGHDYSEKELTHMLTGIDLNGSGDIELREFMDMIAVANAKLPHNSQNDENNAHSLVTSLVPRNGDAAGNAPPAGEDSALDIAALQKILTDDFDLHSNIEEVIPGPITFKSLQMFLTS